MEPGVRSRRHEDYVVQEHVRLDEVLSGRPYMRLVKRMTVGEFLSTEQPAAVKRKLHSIVAERNTTKALS
jgi:hypothetical protein